jgi:hypothetical protein
VKLLKGFKIQRPRDHSSPHLAASTLPSGSQCAAARVKLRRRLNPYYGGVWPWRSVQGVRGGPPELFVTHSGEIVHRRAPNCSSSFNRRRGTAFAAWTEQSSIRFEVDLPPSSLIHSSFRVKQ